MAMKICKDCGTEVSKIAKICPKCGKDQRNIFIKHKILLFVIIIFVVFFILFSLVDINIIK